MAASVDSPPPEVNQKWSRSPGVIVASFGAHSTIGVLECP